MNIALLVLAVVCIYADRITTHAGLDVGMRESGLGLSLRWLAVLSLLGIVGAWWAGLYPELRWVSDLILWLMAAGHAIAALLNRSLIRRRQRHDAIR